MQAGGPPVLLDLYHLVGRVPAGQHGRARPWRGYASALTAPLGHATVAVDPFHAIRLANAVVD
jgi:hypothetical protein